MICDRCNKVNGNDNVFCLNCGKLLRDYFIRPSNLDYSGNEDDLLAQIASEYGEIMKNNEDLMESFTDGLDKSSMELIDANKRLDNYGITLGEFEVKIIEIFNNLSYLFRNTLVSIQSVAFEMLQYSNIIYEILSKYEEYKRDLDKSHTELIGSIKSLIRTAKTSEVQLLSIDIENSTQKFEMSKTRLSLAIDDFIVFYESFCRELNYIKDNHENTNYMTSGNNHSHFCIYCGAKLEEDQNFCTQCGKAVYREEEPVAVVPSKYDKIIDNLEQDYYLKQKKALELVEKQFNPPQMTYTKFSSSIQKSNQLFADQLEITRKIVELDNDNNEVVEKEIEDKIKTLETFIDKMEDLINELVILLSTNKEDEDDINNLFEDMDDLIGSVKDY